MVKPIHKLETELRVLDQRIKPIAKRPVDINERGWYENMASATHPLDEAGIREEAEQLMLDVIETYESTDGDSRDKIRELFRVFDSFAWAGAIPLDVATAEGFRAHIVRFSITDQRPDPRDATLWLQDLCEKAVQNGIDAGPVLNEIAAISSDEDRYAWGSTQQWLIKAAQ